MKDDDDLKEATDLYKKGWMAGDIWVEHGGDLLRDGPPNASEEYYNGFIDRLAKARRLAKKTVH